MYARQQGFAGVAILILLLLLGVSSIMGIAGTTSNTDKQKRAADTREALIAAKQALLAFAVGNPNRGYLPCPADPALVGTPTEGTQMASCNSDGLRIGRLPWRTLGTPELRDGYGELLWYAVSADFTNTNDPINSAASTGLLTVNGVVGHSAIVFSPGSIATGQDRSATVAACATTGTSIRKDYCAANYLDVDTVSGASNADGDVTFARSTTAPFNDQLTELNAAQLLDLFEKRVLNDVKTCLIEYSNAPGNSRRIFPWAHEISDGDPDDPDETYRDEEGELIGRVADEFDDFEDYDWAPTCPLAHSGSRNWLTDWREQVFYVVAPDFSPDGPGFPSGTGTLTVTLPSGTVSNVRAAILIAGKPVTGQVRANDFDRQNQSNYLEGNDLGTFGSSPQTWDSLPISSTFNDRVMVVAKDP